MRCEAALGVPGKVDRPRAGELTIDAKYIEENRVFVATDGKGILGWCALAEEDGEYWVDYCWVLPGAIGRGTGRALIRHIFRLAAELGAATLKVIADPNAEEFYRKLGFHRIGEYPSVPAGRRLPVLEAVVGQEAGS